MTTSPKEPKTGAVLAGFDGSDESLREHSQDQLAGIAEECRQANPDLVVHSRMAEGPPEKTLPEVADELEPELLVVGSSGLGALSRAVLGSTAAELVNTVRRPVYGAEQHSEMTEAVIELRLERLRQGHPRVHVESDVVANRPSAALMERAADARLLVVGSHGRGRLDRILLGSVSHAALYHSPCPVAVVRDGSSEVA